MKASELIAKIQELVDKYGDLDCSISYKGVGVDGMVADIYFDEASTEPSIIVACW